MRTIAWSLYAAVGGALWAACFGMEPLVVVPWIGLTPLLLVLGSRVSGRLALLWGIAFWAVSLHWIVPTMVTFGGLDRLTTWPLFLVLAAYLSLFTVAFARLSRGVWVGGRPLVAMTAVGAIWVAGEWMRSWLLGGFPWNMIAYAWLDVPGALAVSAWVGAYGVSFLVVWSNAGIARGILDRDWRPVAWGLLLPVAILGSAWRWNHRALSAGESPGTVLEARVLQPDIPNLPTWDPAANQDGYRRLIAQSVEACDVSDALLVWPESAAWPRRLGRDADLEADVRSLARRGCGVLVNMPRHEGERYFNSVVLVRPDDSRPYYDKRHLVPFGEYVPFRALLPAADALTRHVGDFTAGDEVRLLEYGGAVLGGAICYEVVFPEEVAETVAAGATVLVSVTNDDWYGPTSAAWQHLTAARFRAAETRRTLLRAAITGVSAVIAPTGELVDHVPPGERRTMTATVVPRSDLTPYVRWGRAVPWIAILVSAFAILLGVRAARRDRPSPTKP